LPPPPAHPPPPLPDALPIHLSTSAGTVVISTARHRTDTGPLDPDCPCQTCRTASRAYLRHLFMAREILYSRLATLHNLTFYARQDRKSTRLNSSHVKISYAV